MAAYIQDFTVNEEPDYQALEGFLKPGIVVIVGQVGVVIAVQVAGQKSGLERVRRKEIRKYADNPDLNWEITHTTGTTSILLPLLPQDVAVSDHKDVAVECRVSFPHGSVACRSLFPYD